MLFSRCVRDSEKSGRKALRCSPTKKEGNADVILPGRLLSYSMNISQRSRTMHFFREILGMTVLRHNEFSEDSENTGVEPTETRWSRTMVGYGPEEKYFTLELIYNYQVQNYNRGNALIGITIKNSNCLKRAKRMGWPILDGNVLEAPDGFKFQILDESEHSKRDPIYSVVLAISNPKQSMKYWQETLGMDPIKPMLLGYDPTGTFIELRPIDGQITQGYSRGRLSFCLPQKHQEFLEYKLYKCGYKILMPVVAYEGELLMLLVEDPDGHELCFYNEAGHRKVAVYSPDDEQVLDKMLAMSDANKDELAMKMVSKKWSLRRKDDEEGTVCFKLKTKFARKSPEETPCKVVTKKSTSERIPDPTPKAPEDDERTERSVTPKKKKKKRKLCSKEVPCRGCKDSNWTPGIREETKPETKDSQDRETQKLNETEEQKSQSETKKPKTKKVKTHAKQDLTSEPKELETQNQIEESAPRIEREKQKEQTIPEDTESIKTVPFVLEEKTNAKDEEKAPQEKKPPLEEKPSKVPTLKSEEEPPTLTDGDDPEQSPRQPNERFGKSSEEDSTKHEKELQVINVEEDKVEEQETKPDNEDNEASNKSEHSHEEKKDEEHTSKSVEAEFAQTIDARSKPTEIVAVNLSIPVIPYPPQGENIFEGKPSSSRRPFNDKSATASTSPTTVSYEDPKKNGELNRSVVPKLNKSNDVLVAVSKSSSPVGSIVLLRQDDPPPKNVNDAEPFNDKSATASKSPTTVSYEDPKKNGELNRSVVPKLNKSSDVLVAVSKSSSPVGSIVLLREDDPPPKNVNDAEPKELQGQNGNQEEFKRSDTTLASKGSSSSRRRSRMVSASEDQEEIGTSQADGAVASKSAVTQVEPSTIRASYKTDISTDKPSLVSILKLSSKNTEDSATATPSLQRMLPTTSNTNKSVTSTASSTPSKPLTPIVKDESPKMVPSESKLNQRITTEDFEEPQSKRIKVSSRASLNAEQEEQKRDDEEEKGHRVRKSDDVEKHEMKLDDVEKRKMIVDELETQKMKLDDVKKKNNKFDDIETMLKKQKISKLKLDASQDAVNVRNRAKKEQTKMERKASKEARRADKDVARRKSKEDSGKVRRRENRESNSSESVNIKDKGDSRESINIAGQTDSEDINTTKGRKSGKERTSIKDRERKHYKDHRRSSGRNESPDSRDHPIRKERLGSEERRRITAASKKRKETIDRLKELRQIKLTKDYNALQCLDVAEGKAPQDVEHKGPKTVSITKSALKDISRKPPGKVKFAKPKRGERDREGDHKKVTEDTPITKPAFDKSFIRLAEMNTELEKQMKEALFAKKQEAKELELAKKKDGVKTKEEDVVEACSTSKPKRLLDLQTIDFLSYDEEEDEEGKGAKEQGKDTEEEGGKDDEEEEDEDEVKNTTQFDDVKSLEGEKLLKVKLEELQQKLAENENNKLHEDLSGEEPHEDLHEVLHEDLHEECHAQSANPSLFSQKSSNEVTRSSVRSKLSRLPKITAKAMKTIPTKSSAPKEAKDGSPRFQSANIETKPKSEKHAIVAKLRSWIGHPANSDEPKESRLKAGKKEEVQETLSNSLLELRSVMSRAE